jgi:hypothetical protein
LPNEADKKAVSGNPFFHAWFEATPRNDGAGMKTIFVILACFILLIYCLFLYNFLIPQDVRQGKHRRADLPCIEKASLDFSSAHP